VERRREKEGCLITRWRTANAQEKAAEKGRSGKKGQFREGRRVRVEFKKSQGKVTGNSELTRAQECVPSGDRGEERRVGRAGKRERTNRTCLRAKRDERGGFASQGTESWIYGPSHAIKGLESGRSRGEKKSRRNRGDRTKCRTRRRVRERKLRPGKRCWEGKKIQESSWVIRKTTTDEGSTTR